MMATADPASIDFAPLMGPVCLALLGEPAEKHHAGMEWRYGTRGSLSVRIDKGTFFDNECGVGGGTLKLLEHRTGMEKSGALEWMRERKIIEDQPKPADKSKPRIVATYDYTDATGELLFQVIRFDPKDFRQRRPDGNGRWIWKMAAVEKVIYRLAAVTAAVAVGCTVFICEGEKGVHALQSIGLVGPARQAGPGSGIADTIPPSPAPTS
jgi:hypothetical protein